VNGRSGRRPTGAHRVGTTGFTRGAPVNKNKDTTGQYISWIAQRTDVYGFVFNGLWLDIGHKDALEEARRLFS